MGRRQQHFKFRCRAALEFAPRGEREEAGLTVRATEDFRYDLAVHLDGHGGREAVLLERLRGVSKVIKRVPLGAGTRVELQVEGNEKGYQFGVAAAGGPPASLGTLPAQGLTAEHIQADGRNYFTGVYLALYATGNGERSTAPADFDWFEYTPL